MPERFLLPAWHYLVFTGPSAETQMNFSVLRRVQSSDKPVGAQPLHPVQVQTRIVLPLPRCGRVRAGVSVHMTQSCCHLMTVMQQLSVKHLLCLRGDRCFIYCTLHCLLLEFCFSVLLGFIPVCVLTAGLVGRGFFPVRAACSCVSKMRAETEGCRSRSVV